MNECCECQKHKNHPRSQDEINNIKARLNKVIGQLRGIDKMIDDNRYCGDIINQIGAATNALNQIGYIVLKTHLDTCVRDDMISGKDGVVEETISLMKNLK